LARGGLPVAGIARYVGIRYRHARNVLSRSGLFVTKSALVARISAKNSKRSGQTGPRRTVERLLESGFSLLGNWLLEADRLVLEQPAPRKAGVCVFAKDGAALYVGVSSSWQTPRDGGIVGRIELLDGRDKPGHDVSVRVVNLMSPKHWRAAAMAKLG